MDEVFTYWVLIKDWFLFLKSKSIKLKLDVFIILVILRFYLLVCFFCLVIEMIIAIWVMNIVKLYVLKESFLFFFLRFDFFWIFWIISIIFFISLSYVEFIVFESVYFLNVKLF